MSGNPYLCAEKTIFDMKKIALLLVMAAFAFVSCDKNGKTSPDVRTYGFTGDVKEVQLSTMDPALEEEGEDPWLEESMLEFSFDEMGRVTEDDYGNQFKYDDEGNVISQFKEITRDEQGRIVRVVNNILDEDGEFLDENLDVFDYCEVLYTYDEKGRVVTEDYSGWEWGTVYTYEYEGDKFYPCKATFKSYNEGFNEEGTLTYEYLTFDDKGNWTSRNLNRVASSYEEPWEEDQEPEIETSEETIRQIRQITYLNK
jgi:hypothetical protein